MTYECRGITRYGSTGIAVVFVFFPHNNIMLGNSLSNRFTALYVYAKYLSKKITKINVKQSKIACK